MGLIGGLLGNAGNISENEARKKSDGIILESEEIDLAFKLVRDLIIFTNKRLIIINKQGVTGKKTTYHSLPYKSISRFLVETTGHFDLDAELKIFISSAIEPAITLQFTNDKHITTIQQALAVAVL
ncbi:PH domain-containing protein [Carnobacterium viridans]|uniref:PH domain-containing protein n=1 Tax=Carnobacterium viridans TaxID=174587 RepID=A0A1H0Y842_9LACT|nr:PH domain-containing protein [Carnobacterium viridans]UDE95295.1 PH domain-containing protein [Carnobacterium viridans]SDQ11280.1 PH domain-containing protein [Carnobacterium viridans]